MASGGHVRAARAPPTHPVRARPASLWTEPGAAPTVVVMAELKTRPDDSSVDAYLEGVSDLQRRADTRSVMAIMQEVTGEPPRLWGGSMIGFGTYHYRYETGREGDWFLTGVAPRKGALTVYIMAGFDRYEALMARLGKHSVGRSCLYIKRLSDVDLDVLRELIERSVRHTAETYGG